MSTASELARFETFGNGGLEVDPRDPRRRSGDGPTNRRRTDAASPPEGGGRLRNDEALVGTTIRGEDAIRPQPSVPGDRVADNGVGGGRTTLPTTTPTIAPGKPTSAVPIDGTSTTTVDELLGGTGDVAPADDTQPGQPATDPNAIGLENLGGLLERLLGSPDVFGNEQILGLRESLARERARERRDVGSSINVDAARRGVLQSSIPVTERIGLEDRLAGRAEDADVQLLNLAAQSRAQQLNTSIGQAFSFLGLGQQNDQLLGQLGGLAEQLGIQGAPNQGQGIEALLGLPGGGGGGINPQLLQQLGALFGQGQGGGGGGGGTGGLDINALIQQLIGGGGAANPGATDLGPNNINRSGRPF